MDEREEIAEAVERIRAAVAQRRAHVMKDAKRAYPMNYEEEAASLAEHATVPSVKLTDMEALLAILARRTPIAAERAVAPYRHGRHPWTQPGDEPDRVFILRFSDPDMREQVFQGEDAETRAWDAWNLYAPAWNVYLFATLAQDDAARRTPIGWRTIESAPKDGTRLLAWCVHRNAQYAKPDRRHEWEGPVVASWTDYNGGGWTWNGHAGTFTHWAPLPASPLPEGAAP